jgi:hypothetical protein
MELQFIFGAEVMVTDYSQYLSDFAQKRWKKSVEEPWNPKIL